MFQIKNLTNEPCLLCDKKEDNAVVKSKTFQGVLCKDHLFAIMKKHTKEQPKEPKA
jgi:hypothetical protein